MYESNAPFFWREFRRNSGHTCCSHVTHVLTASSRDRQWEITKWREGHGSQTIQRQWEKHPWKSTLCAVTKARKANTAKARRAKTRAKERKHEDKHESSPKFEGHCGHCGKWGDRQKDCRYKNTVAEVDEENSVEPPNSSASCSANRVTPPPPGLFPAGTA